jgi:hypothetical protein
MIRIAGTEVPLSAVAELARRMSHDRDSRLGTQIGRAIDGGAHAFNLPKRDYAALLLAIERHQVDGLEPLRLALGGRDGQTDGKPETAVPAPEAPDFMAPISA